MEIDVRKTLEGRKKAAWESLLASFGLVPDGDPDLTVLLWEDDELLSCGSLCGNIIKYVAVSESRQGEGLTATLLTELRSIAFEKNIDHLFLYTKPQNRDMFTSLFFYPVAESRDVLLLESEKDGVRKFLSTLPRPHAEGKIGACVMNCNPFTLGHRYLIDRASGLCDYLYVFILSEDKSAFSADARISLARENLKDLENVCVLPSGDYLISSATFPNYFLKDREHSGAAHCMLDIEIFSKYYAPHFNITRRFVGSEPLSPLTDSYNKALLKHLPKKGIEVIEVPRLEKGGAPVSASAVRALLGQHKPEELLPLIPPATFKYLEENNLI